jgi:hypothetical protein
MSRLDRPMYEAERGISDTVMAWCSRLDGHMVRRQTDTAQVLVTMSSSDCS